LGETGLTVSALGLGAGALGDASLTEREAASLLQGALDLGFTLVDTAPSYGVSEERIGRHLSDRRHDFVLSTKCGYGVPGVEDWTPRCIELGVELALKRLRTEVIDVLHLHSCEVGVLERPGLLDALERAVRNGKVRVAAYSGENEALSWAMGSGRFGVVQRSVNLADQGLLDEYEAKGSLGPLGCLAKRALANAAWDFRKRPAQPDVALYWDRLKALELTPGVMEPAAFALRFAAHAKGVSSCLVGTRSLSRLRELRRHFDDGPLPDELLQSIRASWRTQARDWRGQI
jgi:aryl-alcohol dehydrogenase-like predicted oxidoreductase